MTPFFHVGFGTKTTWNTKMVVFSTLNALLIKSYRALWHTAPTTSVTLFFDRHQVYVSQVPSSNCRTLLRGTYAPSASTTQSYVTVHFSDLLNWPTIPLLQRPGPAVTLQPLPGTTITGCTIYAAPAVPLRRRLPPTSSNRPTAHFWT